MEEHGYDVKFAYHVVRLLGEVEMILVEANLVALAAEAKLGFIDDLVTRKVQGKETETLPDDEADFHAREIGRLTATLLDAAAASTLPDRPTASPALHDLLVRLRLGR